MDAADYKAAKAGLGTIRLDAFDAILRVVAACDPHLASAVQDQLFSEPLERPAAHDGATGSTWLRVALSDDLAESVLDCLAGAEVDAVGSDGSTNAAASYAASLVDAWQHWMEHHEA
jgi:hypothetical protein